ncbi:uncharacterized protein LOC107273245 [Cephus cinctus]|uniref:Uncharacterized protein LOC107273245 n=1 Tax=Cephus cinctus TaxID=211228 RepID=A0AAJ7CBM5_CEPCN|nr:uncharacterized protein LOC107273245 [Cephus cinctus]
MAKFYVRFVIFVILAACTCGGKTECNSRAQISLLTGVHNDASCHKVSTKGVLLYEAAKFLTDAHNNRTNGFKLEMAVLDTCGSIAGALKAAMKALVWADINCLQPPHYLGIIGPDTATNAEAVQKVTSVLKIPHIVRKGSNSPYLHYLAKESDNYIVQATLQVINALKWKSFTLVANVDKENDDDIQNIAKKLTVGAIAKGLCVLVQDNDEDLTSQVIHIGKPDINFFSSPINATVLVVSEGNLEAHLNHVNSTNTILLLEDDRRDLEGLEVKVEQSRWWAAENGAGKFDPEELRDVRWLEDAIEVYAKALDTTCKKKKCKYQVNLPDWNSALTKALSAQNAESQKATRTLSLSIKSRDSVLENIGKLVVKKDVAKIIWKTEKDDDDDDNDDDDQDDDAAPGKKSKDDKIDDDHDALPEVVKKIIINNKDSKTGCATTPKEVKILREEDEDDARVVVSEMDDSEWWTMVGTVSGVGVAMFVVGILAVYVVYSNIRGPVSPKNKSGKGRNDRDTSLRRVGSDREMPSSNTGRNQRQQQFAQRRDSNRSISSNVSDKSV